MPHNLEFASRFVRGIVALLLWVSSFGVAEAFEPDRVSKRFALLVGIQSYPNLSDAEQLHGSRNDVQLIQEMLVNRFQFPAENVRILLDEQATSEAIRAEFAALTREVDAVPNNTPTQVVFHFSGHGSQVPDQRSGPDADEPDGLDETIVPYDASRQGGDADIRDDEINAFARQVCVDESTKLWIILDCCHSGTGVRGSTFTRFRALDRRIPRLDPVTRENQNRGIVEKKLPRNAVALYACQSVEKEPEFREDDRSFGLLSRFLTRVLNETSDLSKLSYGRLAETLQSRYRQDRRVIPAPQPRIEGSAAQIVCGAGPELDRAPYWRVVPLPSNRSYASIAAGSFHGMTVGSLFRLYREPDEILDDPDRAVCWLRIETVELTTSVAQVLEREGDEWFESSLPRSLEQGYAQESFHDHGDSGAHVRVVLAVDQEHDSEPLTRDDPRVPPAVRVAFDQSGREDETVWLHWAGPAEAYDMLLRIDEPYVALFPAIAMSYRDQEAITERSSAPVSLRGGWGPFDLRRDSRTAFEILESLRRIVRARNLIRLVDLQQDQSDRAAQVDVTLERLNVKAGAVVSREPWIDQQSRRDADQQVIISDRQYYDWRITNVDQSGRSFYVTVLQVDSSLGIQTMVPEQLGAESPRLEPGMSLTAGGFECCRDDEGRPQFGPRWTIVLTTSEPNHYSWLSQPSLPRIRGPGKLTLVNSEARTTALDELLLGELYFTPRGDRPTAASSKSIDTRWSVVMQRWLASDAEGQQ